MRTLADMSEVERAKRIGLWCEDDDGAPGIYMGNYRGVGVVSYPASTCAFSAPLDGLTPRDDLPRAWTPDGQPTAGEWEYVNEPRFQNHKRRFIGEWEETQD